MEPTTTKKSAAKRTAAKRTAPTKRPSNPRPAPTKVVEPDEEMLESEEGLDDGSPDDGGFDEYPDSGEGYAEFEYDVEEPAYGTELPARPRSSRTLTVAVAIVAVLFAAAAVFEWFQVNDKNGQIGSSRALQASALSAATTYGGYLSSYNYADLNGPTAPWTEVDSHATASFQQQFDSTKNSLSTLVTTYKATATGKVLSVGLKSVSGTNAAALVFVDQTITNSTSKSGPTTQPLRVEVDLVRSHGQWLINQVQVPK